MFSNTAPLIPATRVRADFSISSMSEWRWRKAGLLPEPVKIRGRAYYRRDELEQCYAKLMEGGAG